MSYRTAFLLLLVATFLVGHVQSARQAQPAQVPQPPETKKFSASDLEKLRWVEGTWRGSGDVDAPFFERYRFESETTLAVDAFTDETLKSVEDTTRFELKDGQFSNGGEGSRWIATTIDYQGATFEPLVKAKNSFRWQRESDNTWTAILKWSVVDGKPGRQRVYKMERWPRKGQ
jgi:hypothetical protein